MRTGNITRCQGSIALMSWLLMIFHCTHIIFIRKCSHIHKQFCKVRHCVIYLTYPFGFTITVVANESLRLIEPGPPGLTALHPIQRMRWNTSSWWDRAEWTPGHWSGTKGMWRKKKDTLTLVGLEPASAGLEGSNLNHDATNGWPPVDGPQCDPPLLLIGWEKCLWPDVKGIKFCLWAKTL